MLGKEVTASPTDPATILEPHNVAIDVSELYTICQSKEFEAQKLWKGRSKFNNAEKLVKTLAKLGR